MIVTYVEYVPNFLRFLLLQSGTFSSFSQKCSAGLQQEVGQGEFRSKIKPQQPSPASVPDKVSSELLAVCSAQPALLAATPHSLIPDPPVALREFQESQETTPSTRSRHLWQPSYHAVGSASTALACQCFHDSLLGRLHECSSFSMYVLT